jgi:hypothetical protein
MLRVLISCRVLELEPDSADALLRSAIIGLLLHLTAPC